MSSHSHQRKQELLDTLAISRLEILDGADELGVKMDRVLSLPEKVGSYLKNNPALLVTSAGLGGFILFKMVSSFFSLRHARHDREGSSLSQAARQGFVGVALTSLWGVVFSAMAPMLRDKVEGYVRKKLGNAFSMKD